MWKFTFNFVSNKCLKKSVKQPIFYEKVVPDMKGRNNLYLDRLVYRKSKKYKYVQQIVCFIWISKTILTDLYIDLFNYIYAILLHSVLLDLGIIFWWIGLFCFVFVFVCFYPLFLFSGFQKTEFLSIKRIF